MIVYRKQVQGMRNRQEDYFLAIQAKLPNGEETGLFAIADGIGRLEMGDLASRTAVQLLNEWFRDEYPYVYDEPYVSLIDTIYYIQQRIKKEGHKRNCDIGTSLTVCFVYKNTITCYYLGDTKAWIYYQNGDVVQMTEDHVQVSERTGKVGLTKACVSFSEPFYPDQVGPTDLTGVMTLIMASDGGAATTDVTQLIDVPPVDVPALMIDLSEAEGNRDNKTVLCVDFLE